MQLIFVLVLQLQVQLVVAELEVGAIGAVGLGMVVKALFWAEGTS